VYRDMREATCLTSVSPLPDSLSHGHSVHGHAAKTVRLDDPAGARDAAFEFEPVRYELPDGQAIVLERERYQVGEFLLHPKNFETTVLKTEQHAAAAARTPSKGLHRMLYDAVQLCDADMRRDMLSNIILCGGGSLTPGLTERLHAELSAMVPSTFKVRFTTVQKVERQFSVFIGASILASLGSFQQLWISKQEFEEVGAHALCADRFV
jgi:actin-like protein 6A